MGEHGAGRTTAAAGTGGAKHEAPASFQLSPAHRRYILYKLRNMVGENDAEDVLQEAYLHAFINRDTYQGVYPWDTWVMGIARYRALNFIGKLRRQPAGKLLGKPVEDVTYSGEAGEQVSVQSEGSESSVHNRSRYVGEFVAASPVRRREWAEEVKLHLPARQALALLVSLDIDRDNKTAGLVGAERMRCTPAQYYHLLSKARKTLHRFKIYPGKQEAMVRM